MTIIDRLENWAAWCRSGAAKSHCRSIEHRYRSPQCWESPQPKREVDERDAVLVEKALSVGNGMPIRWHDVLKYHYVLRMPARTACRKLAIHWLKYDEFLNMAITALENRLSRV